MDALLGAAIAVLNDVLAYLAAAERFPSLVVDADNDGIPFIRIQKDSTNVALGDREEG